MLSGSDLPSEPTATPEISVVIPTLARYGLLARVLDRLASQTLLHRFEVIIAVDAAESHLEQVKQAVGSRRFPVRVVQAQNPGVSAARNCGWRRARAPILLFIGDDMLPRPSLVATHLEFHRRTPQAEIGLLGHVEW